MANKCFHCGSESVIWENDFTFEEYCIEGDGVVHVLHYAECGADITYFVPDEADCEHEAE